MSLILPNDGTIRLVESRPVMLLLFIHFEVSEKLRSSISDRIHKSFLNLWDLSLIDLFKHIIRKNYITKLHLGVLLSKVDSTLSDQKLFLKLTFKLSPQFIGLQNITSMGYLVILYGVRDHLISSIILVISIFFVGDHTYLQIWRKFAGEVG